MYKFKIIDINCDKGTYDLICPPIPSPENKTIQTKNERLSVLYMYVSFSDLRANKRDPEELADTVSGEILTKTIKRFIVKIEYQILARRNFRNFYVQLYKNKYYNEVGCIVSETPF